MGSGIQAPRDAPGAIWRFGEDKKQLLQLWKQDVFVALLNWVTHTLQDNLGQARSWSK